MGESQNTLIEWKNCYSTRCNDAVIGWSSPSEESLSAARQASNLDDKENSDSTTESENLSVRQLSDDCVSDILGYECGEPLKPQHLKIDFNPLVGLDDNEYVLNKCMAFWKMIEETPAIQHLKVLPEMVDDIHSFQDSIPMDKNNHKGFALDEDITPNLDGVEIIEKDAKKVNNIFATKFNKQYCDEGSSDYALEDTKVDRIKIPEEDTTKTSRKEGSSRIKSYWQNEGVLAKQHSSMKRASLKKQARQREEFAKLCRELEEWDTKHPKVMDPPTHPPTLCHAVMQRN